MATKHSTAPMEISAAPLLLRRSLSFFVKKNKTKLTMNEMHTIKYSETLA